MNLFCPKCNEVFARRLPNGRFHVLVSDGKNKKHLNKLRKILNVLICQAPIIVECAKKTHCSDEEGVNLSCDCFTRVAQILARPYRTKRRGGQWLVVNLQKTKGLIECADGRTMCSTPECEEEMFLKDFFESGKTLGTETTRKLARTEYKNGQVQVRAVNNPPDEWLDYEI